MHRLTVRKIRLFCAAAVLLAGIAVLCAAPAVVCSREVITMSDTEQMVTLCGRSFGADSEEITISGPEFSPEELEKALPEFPNLKKVILENTGLDNDTLDALNRRNPEVAIVWTVSLGKIQLRTDAIEFYCATRGYLPTNEELKNLRYCTEMIAVDIGHLRATECEWLEYMPHVKYLILADTGITDISPVANLKELIYLELFALNLSDYSPLLSCTSLQDLNISSTHADPEPLSHMTWLHNLHWYQGLSNPDTREAVKMLPEQLPETNVMLDMVGNISNPWRNLCNYYVFRDIIGGEFLNQSFIYQNWGSADARKILACDRQEPFAGDVLAELVRERIESGTPIIGIKDINSEKARILYETLCNSRP